MKSYLKKVEEILKAEPDPAFARRARIIFANLELKNGQKILDVGCGRGFYLKTLGALGLKLNLHGIDLNQKYLDVAQRIVKKPVHLTKAEATNLPFRKNSFDRIIASEILEHIPNDEKAISEIYRVLRPNGIAMITVPNKNYPFFWDPLNWSLERLFNWHLPSNIWWLAGLWADHLRLYEKKELGKKLKKAGFKIKKTWNTTHYCFPFSHFLLYGIGKNLVEKGFFKSFNRFEPQTNSFLLDKLLLSPLRQFDGFNKDCSSFSSVNIVLKLRK